MARTGFLPMHLAAVHWAGFAIHDTGEKPIRPYPSGPFPLAIDIRGVKVKIVENV